MINTLLKLALIVDLMLIGILIALGLFGVLPGPGCIR